MTGLAVRAQLSTGPGPHWVSSLRRLHTVPSPHPSPRRGEGDDRSLMPRFWKPLRLFPPPRRTEGEAGVVQSWGWPGRKSTAKGAFRCAPAASFSPLVKGGQGGVGRTASASPGEGGSQKLRIVSVFAVRP
jgi:hypothetical protein